MRSVLLAVAAAGFVEALNKEPDAFGFRVNKRQAPNKLEKHSVNSSEEQLV